MISFILIVFLVLIFPKLFEYSHRTIRVARLEKAEEEHKTAAESLICGYCLRETDVYTEPTLDNIIEKFLIPQGIGPQDAVVYAVYGDYKKKRVTDFSKYTAHRALAPKERKVIRRHLRAEFEQLYPTPSKKIKKKKQERTDIFRAPAPSYGTGICWYEYSALTASGCWIPQKPLTRAQQLKQFLSAREKESSLDWRDDLYIDAAKRKTPAPIAKRVSISNNSETKQECVRSKNVSNQVKML